MDHKVKALVLAAGKGTRLQTEGVDLPKVMRLADGKQMRIRLRQRCSGSSAGLYDL